MILILDEEEQVMYHTESSAMLCKFMESRANELNIMRPLEFTAGIPCCFTGLGVVLIPVTEEEFDDFFKLNLTFVLSTELTEKHLH